MNRFRCRCITLMKNLNSKMAGVTEGEKINPTIVRSRKICRQFFSKLIFKVESVLSNKTGKVDPECNEILLHNRIQYSETKFSTKTDPHSRIHFLTQLQQIICLSGSRQQFYFTQYQMDNLEHNLNSGSIIERCFDGQSGSQMRKNTDLESESTRRDKIQD